MSAVQLVLHIEHGDGGRQRVEWDDAPAIVKLGTLPSVHAAIRGDGVARLHAVIERTGQELMVIDLGSPTGTKVNGEHRNKAQLIDGDVLTLGDATVRIEVPSWRPARLDQVQEPPRVGRCPRCERALALCSAEPQGYRDAPMRYLRCDPCGVSVVESATIEGRYGRADVLTQSVGVRARETVGELCPACLEDLDRVTLEWGAKWVVVEECPSCRCVVLDDGEGLTLDAVLRAMGG